MRTQPLNPSHENDRQPETSLRSALVAVITTILVLPIPGCGAEGAEDSVAGAPDTPQVYEQRELIQKLKFDADAFRKEHLGKTVRVLVGVDEVADLGELFDDPIGGAMFVSWGEQGAGNSIAVNFEKTDGLYERLRGMRGEVIEVEGVVSAAGVTDSPKVPGITLMKARVLRIR